MYMGTLLTKREVNWDDWKLAQFFFRVFMDLDCDANIPPGLLTEQAWSINDLLYGI